MNSFFVRSAVACAIVLVSNTMTPAFGQSSPSLKARCGQLMTFFDWYGASRSENTDGARNHTRIAADLDCQSGKAAEGVAAMEYLLRRKKFDVPPAPAGMAAMPMERAPDTAAAVLMR